MVINRIRVLQGPDSERRPAREDRQVTISLDLEDFFTHETIEIRPTLPLQPADRLHPAPPKPTRHTSVQRSARDGRRRRRNLRPSVRRRNRVLAVAIGIAMAIGTLVGSGVLDDRARFNSERYAAGSGEVELYTVPGVYGHPGTQPRAAQARSGSIREFLGMSSTF